jgi:hypothetical protein
MGTLRGFPFPPAIVRRRRGRARSARGGEGGGPSRSPRRGQSRRLPTRLRPRENFVALSWPCPAAFTFGHVAWLTLRPR